MKEGDEFTVDFIENKDSTKKPVCRINGKVGIIDKSVRGYFKPLSTWIVRMVSIHEKFVTIEPLVQIRTKKENEDRINEMLGLVKPKKKEKIKVKKNFQYKTKQQIKDGKEN